MARGIVMAEDDVAKKRNFAKVMLVHNLAGGAITVGRAAGEDVVLVRRGDDCFAAHSNCSVGL